ncbi:MAG: hypothetical protein UIC45_07670 [Paludibacteraceae bacterium]|nr:hypothetical protein [Paludibacteraceae bacterium]
MNVVQFWKELALSHKSYEDFYTTEKFIELLDENVLDWKQQVKDKDLWPELHSYSKNVAESYYLSAIINELGIEYACYLVENESTPHLNAAQALDYISEHLDKWTTFSEIVKQEILDFKLRNFLTECSNNYDYWNSLTKEQKDNVLAKLRIEETQYVSDLLLFNIWSNVLNYSYSPYIVFSTSEFRHMQQEIMRDMDRNENGDRDDRFLNERIMHRIDRWDMPKLNFIEDDSLLYQPSSKLDMLLLVSENCKDETSLKAIQMIKSEISDGFMLASHMRN